MSRREIAYPGEFSASVNDEADIKLRFNATGSRFGPVEIILTADDAEILADEIETAIGESSRILESSS